MVKRLRMIGDDMMWMTRCKSTGWLLTAILASGLVTPTAWADEARADQAQAEVYTSDDPKQQTAEEKARALEAAQRDPDRFLKEQAARNRARWAKQRAQRGEAVPEEWEASSPESADAPAAEQGDRATPRRPRTMREYAEMRNREARMRAATQPANFESPDSPSDPVIEAQPPVEQPANPNAIPHEPEPEITDPGEMRIQADQLPEISDAEVDEAMKAALQEVDALMNDAANQQQAQDSVTGDATPATGDVAQDTQTRPSTPTKVIVNEGQAYPVGQDNKPDLKAGQPLWWKIPPEERPYFFVWENTQVKKVLEDVSVMTGLSWMGETQIQATDAGFFTKTLTFESHRIMTYDEALTTLNELLVDFDYWVCRRENYLEIRKLTEWYRRIPINRMFESVEAYRAAKLPNWELASVPYRPLHKSSDVLAQACVDLVPLNAARASVIDTGMVELSGFVLFIERQLAYLESNDKHEDDPRELIEYKLEHVSVSEAANLLSELLPEVGGGGMDIPGMPNVPTVRNRRPPRGTPVPTTPNPQVDIGTAEVDQVDIVEVGTRNVLLVTATPVNHERIKNYLATYIDVPADKGQAELIKLKYADPEKLAQVIRPMLGSDMMMVPMQPQPNQPNRPNNPQQQQQMVLSTGSTAIITPIRHIQSLLVKASPEEMSQIHDYVKMLDVPQGERKYEYVRLKYVEASGLADLLSIAVGVQDQMGNRNPRYNINMMPGQSFDDQFKAVAAQHDDHGLMLIGEQSEIEEAKAIIDQLDVDDAADAVERIWRLKNAMPSTVTNVLKSRFSKDSGSNNIYGRYGLPASTGGTSLPKFIPDDQSRMLITVCREAMWADIENIITELDKDAEVANTTKVYQLKYVNATSAVSILSQAFGSPSTMRHLMDPNAASFSADYQTNTLVAHADDETHAKVAALIAELDQPGENSRSTRTITLQYADPERAEMTLKELFSASAGSGYGTRGSPGQIPPVFTAIEGTNRLVVSADQAQHDQVDKLIKDIDREDALSDVETRTLKPEHARAVELAPMLTGVLRSKSGGDTGRMSYYGMRSSSGSGNAVDAHDDSNTLLITSTAKEFDQLAALVKTLDVPSGADRTVKAYAIEHADIAAVVQAITSSFGGSPYAGRYGGGGDARDRVDATPDYTTSTVIVTATPDKHTKIESMLSQLDIETGRSTITRTIELQYAMASELAATLTGVLRGGSSGYSKYGSSRGDEPVIQAYDAANRIVVTAPAAQLEEIEALVTALDVQAERGIQTRTLRLQHADAKEMSGTISMMLRSISGGSMMRSSNVYDVQAFEGTNTIVITAPSGEFAKIEEVVAKLDVPSDNERRPRAYAIRNADLDTITTAISSAFPATTMRERVDAVPDESTSSLIVTASEKNHGKVKELIDEMDALVRDERVTLAPIELMHADPDYVAGKLEELFGQQSGGMSSRYYGRGSTNEVRVVAEPVSNRVFISGTTAEYEQAKTFAAQIDSQYADKDYQRKTFELKYVDPFQVRDVIDTMFGEGGSGGSRSPFGGRSRWYGSSSFGSDAGDSPDKIKIVEIGSSLIVYAPKDKMDQIESLINDLDSDSTGKNEIRTYVVKGASGSGGTQAVASSLQQLLDDRSGGSSRSGFYGGGSSGGSTIKFMGSYNSDLLFVSAPASRMAEVDELVNQVIDAQSSADLTLLIRHFDIRYARPQSVADMIQPILDAKYDEIKGSGGGRGGFGGSFYYGGRSSGPQIVAHSTAKRVMVSAPEQLMPLIEQLVYEFDQKQDATTMRIVELDKADAGELAPVVQQMVATSGAAPAYRSGRSPFMPVSTSSSSEDELTVTAVGSSNAIILKGPTAKVDEAEDIIKRLDDKSAPAGPLLKVYDIKHASLYDVVDMVEGMLGISSSFDGPSTGPNGEMVQVDYSSDKIIVAMPREKIPMIDQIVALKEDLAKPEAIVDASDDGDSGSRIIKRDKGMITKAYDVEGSTNDIAGMLDKILVSLLGWADAPYVKSFPFANQIIVEGRPDQFGMVEEWLEKILKNPPKPKMTLVVQPVKEGMSAQRIVEALTQNSGADAQKQIDVQEIPSLSTELKAIDRIKEIRYDTPIESTNGSGASPFVPTNELLRLRTALNGLALGQAPPITVAGNPPAATQPTKAPATQPAAAPVPEMKEQPEAAPTAAEPVAKAEPAAEPAEKTAEAEEKQPAQAQTKVKPEDKNQQHRQAIMGAAMAARASDKVQIRYDPEQRIIFMVGPEPQVKELKSLLDDIMEQYEKLLEDSGIDLPIRVFRVDHIDVSIAAAILEQMFNDKTPQQPKAPRQPKKQPQPKADEKPGEGEGEEESAAARRRREQEEADAAEEEQQQVVAGGQRIRVVPDPRTQTLIIRAAAEDFPLIAELLLKIDRPGNVSLVDIKIFQLKNLNAYEVEMALKEILKIEDPLMNRFRGGMMGMRGMRGGNMNDFQNNPYMMQQMQEQMQLMNTMQQTNAAAAGEEGEGQDGTAVNPTKDMSITSDATTNSIIARAPKEGLRLIGDLIDQLEELDIPMQIKSYNITNGDAETMAVQLEKIFKARRRTATSGMGAMQEGIKGSGLGDVEISADARTNTIVVRALETDFVKIDPIIDKLDQPMIGKHLVPYLVQYGSATEYAETLSKLFKFSTNVSDARAVNIAADETTNILFVKAPEATQEAIKTQIDLLEQNAGTRGIPRQIPLEFAAPSSVAAKLKSIFQADTRSKRGKSNELIIEGDDNSGILFVTAPEEMFKQIESLARQLDVANTNPIRIFSLQYAYADDILPHFKAMLSQIMGDLGAKGDAYSITADTGTNSLIVSGSKSVILACETLLTELDKTQGNTIPTVSLVSLTNATAASVAASINSVYGVYKEIRGIPKPYAVAEPTANVVYIYGTTDQIQSIKTAFIDPIEAVYSQKVAGVNDYVIEIKNARVEDVAATLSSYFATRKANIAAAGTTTMHPAELAVAVTADPVSKRLFVSCSENNKAEIDKLLETLDGPDVSDKGLQTKIFPLKFADLNYTSTALRTVFQKTGKISERERVTISPEYGTNAIIVSANDEIMKQVEQMLAELDVSGEGTGSTIETVALQHAKASEVHKTLTEVIQRNYIRDRVKGIYPVSVTPNDNSNSILISANATHMEQMKKLISQLDVEPIEADDRFIRTYPIKNADLHGLTQIVTQQFPDNATRAIGEQVYVTYESATSTLVVRASEQNQVKIAELVAQLDKVDNNPTRFDRVTIPLEFTRATDVAATVNNVITTTEIPVRGTGKYPGWLVADAATNTLILSAIPDKMQNYKDLIAKLDIKTDEDVDRVPKPYPIKYANYSSVVSAINTAFRNTTKDPRDQVDAVAEAGTYSVVVMASVENHAKIKALIDELDAPGYEGQRDNYIIDIQHADPDDVASALTTIYTTTRERKQRDGRVPAVFTVPPGQKKIIVTTTQEELANVHKLVAELDVADVTGERDVRVVAVQHTTANEMSNVLTEYLRLPGTAGRGGKLVGDVKVMPSQNTNVVVLTGPKANLDELEALAQKIDVSTKEGGEAGDQREVRVIAVINADAASVATAINAAFTPRGSAIAEADKVYAVAERNTSSIVVSASQENHDKIAKMVSDLDFESESAPQKAVVRLEHAQAEDVAAVLTTTYRVTRSGGTPVSIAADNNLNALVISASKADLAGIGDMVAKLDVPPTDLVEELRVIPLEFIDATETLEIMTEYLRKPGGSRSRGGSDLIGDVRLQASQALNALIVSGSKAENDNVERVIKQMDQEVVGAGTQPRIIKVEHASASQLAQTLTSMFSDPARKGSRGRSDPDAVPLILADENMNSLIVRARTVDYNQIEAMARDLDQEVDGPSGMKVIQVSRGVDVQKMATEIERTVNAGERYAAQEQGRKAGAVAIGVDERGPALIVAGTPQLFASVDKLVEQLISLNPAGMPLQPRIVPVSSGISPEDMKRVLEQFIDQQNRTGGKR